MSPRLRNSLNCKEYIANFNANYHTLLFICRNGIFCILLILMTFRPNFAQFLPNSYLA